MFVKLVYTILFVEALFTSTTHAEEVKLQKAAPYPPAGYRPNKAFDLPTEGGTLDAEDEMVDREGRAFEGEIVTTTNSFDENIETTTAVVDSETTTTVSETTTQYPDLQGNKAERLQINPKLLLKSGQQGSYAYSVQYQRW